jgi:hypothetical protein
MSSLNIPALLYHKGNRLLAARRAMIQLRFQNYACRCVVTVDRIRSTPSGIGLCQQSENESLICKKLSNSTAAIHHDDNRENVAHRTPKWRTRRPASYTTPLHQFTSVGHEACLSRDMVGRHPHYIRSKIRHSTFEVAPSVAYHISLFGREVASV